VAVRVLHRHWALLRSAPSFRALFLATVGSGIGTNLATIALIVDVYDRTGSGTWVGALLLVEFLPIPIVGILFGPLVDRLPRRALMIAADLVRLAAFVALPFAPGPGTIVALAAVVGVATAFFRPAVYAGMPNLLDERDLPQANSLLQAADNMTWMLGPLLGGAILAVASPDVNYLVNAATFLISALFLVRIPERRLQAAVASTQGHLEDLREGVRTVLGSRPLVTVLLAWSVASVAIGFVNVSEVALVKESLDAGDLWFGVVMTLSGLGLMVGSLVGGELLERLPMAQAYGLALALMAVGAGVAAGVPSIWLAAVFVTLLGFGNGVAGVCNPLFVQRGAADHVRGRAFSVIMSANAGVLGVAMAVAGPFTDSAGARWVWAAAGGVYGLAAVLGFWLARGIAAPEPLPEVEPVTIAAAGAPAAVPATEPDRL